MTNNQYISNSTEEEQPKGFNKTGVLLLKNRIDKIEYHLYNNKLPYPICCESIDINATLNIHLFNTIRQRINLIISDNNGIIFSGQGRLKKTIENGVDKYYLIDDEYIDIEDILFNNTDKIINIKIITVRNEESDVDEKEGNNVDEPECAS